ncbi:MAG: AzlC family ABC transporter permease [Traorella sp.]
MKKDYLEGFKLGIAIGIGYFCVSFAFGMMVKNASLPTYVAFLISATNLTSAGQFAGLNLMIQQATYMEVIMTTLLINLRYFIMSMSLSQKLDKHMGLGKKLILAFGVTDEIFALSVTRSKPITLAYFMGILTPSFIGWTLGSGCGALFSSLLPEMLSDAMNIALYSMFVAIVIPQAKKDISKRKACLLSIIMSFIFAYLPVLSNLGSGWTIIIITLFVSSLMAFLYPIKEEV